MDESALDSNILYVGTSDANVWRTLDGGTTWDSVHSSLPNRYVTSVKASPSNTDRVFVTHSGYKYNDYIPHVHRSDNNGNSWQDISGNLPPLAVNDLVIYPGHEDSILFVATDGGVYGTVDAGSDWQRVGTNMPIIAVVDLDFDTVNNRLVAATVGKSIMTYPLDSIVVIPPDSGGGNTGSFVVTLTTTDRTCVNTNNGTAAASVIGGVFPYSYQWSNGGTSATIENLDAGTYTVTVTDDNNESVIETTVVAANLIHPDPIVGPLTGQTSAQAWTSFNYSVPLTNGSTFDWQATGGSVLTTASNAAQILWEAGPTGTVVITETDMHGCVASMESQVDILFVGIEDESESLFDVWPNPAQDQIFIRVPKSGSGRVDLYSVNGELAKSVSMSNEALWTIPVSDLPSGYYLLRIESGDRAHHQKILIQ